MTRFLHGTNQAPTSSRTPSTLTIERKERLNGWTCPWHPLQFVAWFFIVVFAVVCFGIFVPHFPLEWRPAGYIIPGGLYIVHMIFHLAALTVDPADQNIRGANFKEKAVFDRTIHAHVIENNHCHICETDVSPTSKHCSLCNKCVSDFDHHCKWLNTCVGGRNYKLFIGCVSSGFICALILLAFNLYLFIIYFVSKSDLTETDGKLKLFVPVDDQVFVIFTGVVAGLLLIAIALLGHLFGFHIYIMCLGISTYEYIVNSRETKHSPRDVESGCETPSISKRFKNKVKPVSDVPEVSETRHDVLIDPKQSVASIETPTEPSIKMMSEVSSKAVKRQGSPPTSDSAMPSPRDSSQSPRIVLHSSGYTNYAAMASSEESLKQLPPAGPPSISVEPPSDTSRPPTSSPQMHRPKSSQSQNDRPKSNQSWNDRPKSSQSRNGTSPQKNINQLDDDTSVGKVASQSREKVFSQSQGDTVLRGKLDSQSETFSEVGKDKANVGAAVKYNLNGNVGIVSSIGELDDDSEEELAPVTEHKVTADRVLNQEGSPRARTAVNNKPKTRKSEGNISTELSASQNRSLKKTKKKRSKTPDHTELPPLATRGRPLPSLGTYGESPC